jgi:aminopeptidase N
MLRILLVCAAAAALGMSVQRRTPGDLPAPGVPLDIAEARAARLQDVRYDLRFTIPADVKAPIAGRAVIRFKLSDATQPLVLDFAGPAGGLSATLGETPVSLDVGNEHIVVPAAALKAGENALALEFTAGDASLNRNPEFLYALFVPARARLAFPCFDQPDIKATFTLALDIPVGWEALSNGAETSRRDEGAAVRVAFAETEPLSTYLFSFAAGKFQIETAERDGRRFRMFHRETDTGKVARNREAIFDLHAAALAWLEDYTAIPYPWGKFDFLLVPSFQFGGMEHAGAIFYNASALLLDPSATVNQKLGRASLIAHETAHMWFGDLVTMRWFDDVWMKEVFANFMAAKIVNPSFPEINHDLRFLLAHYPAAYEVDRTEGTNAIRQRLDNLNEAGSLYGAIIYQKAPIIMRHLELMLGADALRDGLRVYLRRHAFGNASWPDLIALLDERAPEDLKAWSHAWVEEAGRPIITTRIRDESMTFTQHDPIEARGLTWTQNLDVRVAARGMASGPPTRVHTDRTVRLGAGRTEVRGGPRASSLLYVLPNARGIAYGNFVLDARSREYLLRHLHELKDLARGAALVTLWEEMLDGRVKPRAMFDLLLAVTPLEADDLNLQRMLGYTQQAYWRWLAPGERPARAPELEKILRRGLDAATTQSRKSAWFSALRDTAVTPATLTWLERVWKQEEAVPGLDLAEPDFIALAQALALRAVPNWAAILDAQHERIQNPDRKGRFAFVRPALSADTAVRDAFFASLRDAANRRREPWVLEAVGYLHHPLRAAAAEKYIPPSLALLREIQRTGDIFFPKRWMDATLAGHGSAAASRMVADFLASLPPDYPDRLRRVILSSADDLFRSATGGP